LPGPSTRRNPAARRSGQGFRDFTPAGSVLPAFYSGASRRQPTTRLAVSDCGGNGQLCLPDFIPAVCSPPAPAQARSLVELPGGVMPRSRVRSTNASREFGPRRLADRLSAISTSHAGLFPGDEGSLPSPAARVNPICSADEKCDRPRPRRAGPTALSGGRSAFVLFACPTLSKTDKSAFGGDAPRHGRRHTYIGEGGSRRAGQDPRSLTGGGAAWPTTNLSRFAARASTI
jgi:hypothetical protein